MKPQEYFSKLEEHNYWQGQPVRAGIPRPIYVDRISSFSGNRLIKVLVGQRRTGKNYILRQFVQRLLHQGVAPCNIFYLDKEHIDFSDLTDHRQLDGLIRFYLERVATPGKVYLLLDEVQEIAGWEKLAASYAQETQPEFELYVTGSNSHMLSSELGTYLSGRHIPIAIFSLSFAEFCTAYEIAPDKAGLLTYLRRGGLPELINLETDEARRHYVMALRDSVLLNDIVRKFGVQDVGLLEQLFQFLCANIGSYFSINKVVNHLNSRGAGTNFETLSRYLDHLQKALLVHECNRYDIRGKEILAGTRKYFVNDLAFRQYLAPDYDPGLSRRLENCFYLHWKSQGYTVHVGRYRDLEVDFVLERDGNRIYAQICYLLADEAVIEREYRSLEMIRDNYPKLVISLDDAPFGTRNGIQHRLAWEVLSGKE
ncbi:MAG: ATP-binding protein [Lentisphaeria bacterium]|nr:ATP-binding protein [Lentisphaeria bacterium]